MRNNVQRRSNQCGLLLSDTSFSQGAHIANLTPERRIG